MFGARCVSAPGGSGGAWFACHCHQTAWLRDLLPTTPKEKRHIQLAGRLERQTPEVVATLVSSRLRSLEEQRRHASAGPGERAATAAWAQKLGLDPRVTYTVDDLLRKEEELKQQQQQGELLSVVLPVGVAPGDCLGVNIGGGSMIRVLVPAGLRPGQRFHVRRPRTAPQIPKLEQQQQQTPRQQQQQQEEPTASAPGRALRRRNFSKSKARARSIEGIMQHEIRSGTTTRGRGGRDAARTALAKHAVDRP